MAAKRSTRAAAAVAPLRSLAEGAREVVARIESLALLRRAAWLLAAAALVAGVALAAWLVARWLALPDAAATTAAAATAAAAAGPRWGVPVGAVVVSLILFLLAIIGGFAWAARAGRIDWLSACVALFGVWLIVLESYVQIFPVPIFGGGIVLIGGVLFAIQLAIGKIQRMIKEKAAQILKEDFVAQALKMLEDKYPDLKAKLKELGPKLEAVLLEQFREIKGPLADKLLKELEPEIDKAIAMVQAKGTQAIYDATVGNVSSGVGRARSGFFSLFTRSNPVAATNDAATGAEHAAPVPDVPINRMT
jgi:hypothetical protein